MSFELDEFLGISNPQSVDPNKEKIGEPDDLCLFLTEVFQDVQGIARSIVERIKAKCSYLRG
jgi:hypothetical protein